MKKTTLLICIIAALLCFTSCGKKNLTENPSQATEQAEDSADKSDVKVNDDGIEVDENGSTKISVGGDKMSETSFAGTVNVVEEDKITLIVDGKEEFEFTLSEKAKKDIEHFDVKMGTRVVIDFESLSDGTRNALNVNLIKSE